MESVLIHTLKIEFISNSNLKINMNKKNTIPVLTKYELAALLSERAIEIANGAPITIQNAKTTNPIEIAKLEFEAGVFPKTLTRTWLDGTKEKWHLDEMKNYNR